jgi:cytochrome P450
MTIGADIREVLGDIDLMDPALYCTGDPYALWKTLRREAPVCWSDGPGGEGYWSVFRYDDAVAVYRAPSMFSSERGILLSRQVGAGDPAGGKTLSLLDPPRHTELRRLVAGGLSNRVVREVRDNVERLASSLIDYALEEGEIDWVHDVAFRLPVAMTCGLMGVPESDWDYMLDLTRRAAAGDATPLEGDEWNDGRVAHAEILQYYNALVSRRRREPGDDVVSILASAEVGGRPLSDEEVLLNCSNLVVAGNQTTRHATTGCVVTFANHPDQWNRLRATPSLAASAGNEILRWVSPGMNVVRVAKRDATLRDVAIREGDAVCVWNPSANRDELAFERPDEFDVARSPNRHLSLGLGAHYCLGSPLVQLELEVVITLLATRVASIELTAEPVRMRSCLLWGWDSVPVRLRGR